MTESQTIDVTRVIDQSRLGPYQLFVAVLCGLCLIMDGFDTQAMGYVAPAVIQDWHIAKAALAPVFSAALFGMLIGSLAFSALADKIGRRPVLVGATLCFSVCMIATGFADSAGALIGWRFAAGLGLGCIMPNAMALAGEYAPRRICVSLMMLISCGFTVGGVAGGMFSAALIAAYGWRSVFWVGGAIPLVLGALMLAGLPASVHFLLARARRTGRDARVRRQVERLTGAPLAAGVRLTMPEPARPGVPFIALFRDGRARITALLWIVNFANLLDMYFLSNWLPTVIHGAGYSTTTAVLAGSAMWVGGVAGTVLLGPVIDRIGFTKVLAAVFLMAIVTIALIGNPAVIATTGLLVAAIFLTGFAVSGGQPAINALAGVYYPSALRSTGIGWGLGIGRIGAAVGPLIGGLLIHLDWSVQSLFLAAAVPACVTLLGLIAIHFTRRPEIQVQTAAALEP
jgi:AAHS family 4-hydroxybenzoate transporter-like MFS transporter